jgi:membrane-bound lytic murein transglycosylase D
VILAAGTPHILLPWDNAKVFQRNFEAYTQGQYASWTAWTAPSTLSVGDAARRVGMSEEALRGVNNIPPRMLIKAGSTLLVSRTAKTSDDVASHVADNAQMSLAPEIVTRRSTVKARKGETVTSIAKRYGQSVASVAEWNSVSATAAFKLGQQVVLFLPVRAAGPVRAQTRSHIKAVPRNAGKTVIKSKKR